MHLFISNDVLQVSVFPSAQTGYTARTRTRHPRTDGRVGSVRRAMWVHTIILYDDNDVRGMIYNMTIDYILCKTLIISKTITFWKCLLLLFFFTTVIYFDGSSKMYKIVGNYYDDQHSKAAIWKYNENKVMVRKINNSYGDRIQLE